MKPSQVRNTLLVVDDEEELRELVAFHLEKAGFQVLSAAGGRAALEVLGREKIALILSDIRMPQGSGLDLLKAVRATASPVPVILMSAFVDVSVEQARALGAFGLLPKPFHFDALIDLIRKALATR